MTYRNARSIVGVLNCGVALFFCGLALRESIPVRLFPKNEITFLPQVGCFVQTFVFYAVLSMPFDLLGGWVLPWLYKKDYPGSIHFIVAWIRGVLFQAAVAIGCSILIMEAGRSGGVGGGLLATGVLIGLLLVFRKSSSSFLGAVKRQCADGLKDPLAALIWNFGGAILASRSSEVSFLSAAGIVTLGVFVSLWSFVGVLVVPLFLGKRSSRLRQLILFPSWVCFGFLSRCLPAVVGLPEYWVTGNGRNEEG